MNLADLMERFGTVDAARAYLEAQRWPDGPVCPHCGLVGEAYKITPKAKPPVTTAQSRKEATKRVRKPRQGLWKCSGCRKPFTVTLGTIFEDSHIPLNKWVIAVHLMCASKKGMSAHQIHRMLGVTYKSAWFMCHRIRYGMTQEPLASKLSGIVEVDETYIGGKRKDPPMAPKPGVRAVDRPGPFEGKAAVFSVLQRGGKVRSQHIERVTAPFLKQAIRELCNDDVHLMTDTARVYSGFDKPWKHSQVNHSAKEYVRWDDGVCITTNAIESFFSLLKRGVDGTFHHVSKRHLHRYLAEFDFRFNSREMSDSDRREAALQGFEGKRLMYRQPVSKDADNLTGKSSDD